MEVALVRGQHGVVVGGEHPERPRGMLGGDLQRLLPDAATLPSAALASV